MSKFEQVIVCPLDQRYAKVSKNMRRLFSDQFFTKSRLQVEVLWLTIFLQATKQQASVDDIQKIKSIYIEFSTEDYQQIKAIEDKINHDTKAIEYFMQDKLQQLQLSRFIPFIHIGLTSEDTDTTAYALMLQAGASQIQSEFTELYAELSRLAQINSHAPILSLTHGQPATPSTFGKEMVNFLSRIHKKIQIIKSHQLETKLAGSTGNYQALQHSFPDQDWPKIATEFAGTLKLQINHYNTQILPKENWLDLLYHINSINLICISLCQDLWGYIQRGVLVQELKAQEVGSSTMPHKINPINFENAEGNLMLANKLFEFFNSKLAISRFQRDLSDKTSLRNLGLFFSYSSLSYHSILQGLQKIRFNPSQAQAELSANPAVLTELIQTILRKHGVSDAYEQLKEFSRGATINLSQLHEFIDQVELPSQAKQELKKLKPEDYTGLASQLCQQYFQT